MYSNYFIWTEIQANKRTITQATKFRQAMEKCRNTGIGAVILSVKDTSDILKNIYGKFDFKPTRVYRGAYKEF